MKLSDLKERDSQLDELLPSGNVGATAPAPTMSPAATQAAASTQVQNDPQAQAKMMAQQALDRQNRKKEIQNQIRVKQAELQDLQKQLAQLR